MGLIRLAVEAPWNRRRSETPLGIARNDKKRSRGILGAATDIHHVRLNSVNPAMTGNYRDYSHIAADCESVRRVATAIQGATSGTTFVVVSGLMFQ